jgi:hypothetical protein
MENISWNSAKSDAEDITTAGKQRLCQWNIYNVIVIHYKCWHLFSTWYRIRKATNQKRKINTDEQSSQQEVKLILCKNIITLIFRVNIYVYLSLLGISYPLCYKT